MLIKRSGTTGIQYFQSQLLITSQGFQSYGFFVMYSENSRHKIYSLVLNK